MRRLIVTALIIMGLLGIAAQPAMAGDKDCSDFPTQRAAQKWFEHHHPKADPSRLDADHDGIACEDNP